MFQTKVEEIIKTHILLIFTIVFRKSCHLCEIMRTNIVQPDRPQMRVPRMRIACCVPKATDTHPEYVIFTPFALQQWLYESACLYFLNIQLMHVYLGQGPISFRVFHQNHVWISLRTPACHMSSPADSPWSDHPNNTYLLRSGSTETRRYAIVFMLHSEI
jgi:hypothetical protein